MSRFVLSSEKAPQRIDGGNFYVEVLPTHIRLTDRVKKLQIGIFSSSGTQVYEDYYEKFSDTQVKNFMQTLAERMKKSPPYTKEEAMTIVQQAVERAKQSVPPPVHISGIGA